MIEQFDDNLENHPLFRGWEKYEPDWRSKLQQGRPYTPPRAAEPTTPGAPPTGAATESPENMGVLDTLTDIGKGLFAGGYDAVGETVNLLSDGANLFRGEDDQFDDIMASSDSFINVQTGAGKIAKSVSQFVVGFIGAGKFLKAAKLLQGAGKAVTVGRNMAQGAVVDFSVFDAHEERLSNLIESNPELQNPVTEFLAADENDSAAMGRLKNALEGMALGGLVGEALPLIFKGAKAVRTAKTVPEAEDALIRSSDELAEVAAKYNKTPEEAAQQIDATISGDTHALVDAVENAGGKVELDVHGATASDIKYIEDAVRGQVTGQHVMATKAMKEAAARKRLTPDEFGKILDEGMAKGETWEEIYENEFLIGKHLDIDSLAEADLHASYAQKVFDRTLKGKGVQTHNYLRDTAPEWVEAMGHNGVLDAAAHDAALMEHLVVRSIAYKMHAKSIGRKITEMWDGMRLKGEDPLQSEQFVKLSQAYQDLSIVSKDIVTTSARNVRAGAIKTKDLRADIMAGIIKATDGDPEKVLKVLTNTRNRRLGGTLQEVVINGLLSGPKTHLVNITSNLFKSLMMPAEKMLGGAFMGNPQMVQEGVETFFALFKYAGESWKAARMAAKMGENILDVGHKIRDDGGSILGTYDKIVADIKSAKLAKGGKADDALTDMEETQARLMSFIGLPSRALLGMDEWFKQINYRANLYGKLAAEGSVRFGNDAAKLAEYVESGMAAAFDSKGRGLNAGALRYGQEATWTQDMRDGAYFNGGFGQALSDMAKRYPPMRLVTPFIRTPTNLIRDFVAHTPGLNMLTKRFQDAVKAGGERQALAYGQMATGTMLWTTAIGLAMNGSMTGGYPKDPATRQAWIDAGIEPYSFKIGDTYVSFARLDPFATFFGIVADYTEYSRKWDDSAKGNWAAGAVVALAQNITSKSYLTGIADLIDALGDQSVDAKAMQKYMQRSVTMFIPYSSGLRFTRQLVDDPMREVRGVFDSILNAIPGTSFLLPERRSWLTGKAVPHNTFWGVHKDDVVTNEIARLGDSLSIGAPARKLKGVELDGNQYSRLCELQGTVRIGGLTQHERLSRLMKSASYDIGRRRIPDMPGDLGNPRTKAVQDTIRQYREAAQKALLREDRTLAAAAERELKIRTSAKRGDANKVKELLSMPR